MTHLFVSHSTRDGAHIAQQLSAALEAAGHRCWIAPRDVKPGVPYPGQIVTAIEASAGLVLLVTPAANESPDVLQEIQLASTARKTIAPVIVSGCAPGADLRYFLGVRHQIPWSDARGTTAPVIQIGHYDAPSPAVEDDLGGWYAQERFPLLARLPGCVGARKLLATVGAHKHAILHEFVSLEERERHFGPHEAQRDDPQTWMGRVVPQLRHATYSPGVGLRLWPLV